MACPRSPSAPHPPLDRVAFELRRLWFLPRSSLAEFDGAISRLFRKTAGLDNLPQDMPNSYTVTLFDLTTWQEVDVVVDERLARKPDGTGLRGRHVRKSAVLGVGGGGGWGWGLAAAAWLETLFEGPG